MKIPYLLKNEPDDQPVEEMTLIEHLYELRSRLIKSVAAILVGAILVFTFFDPIFEFLSNPYCDLRESKDQECSFLVTNPLQSFNVQLTLSGYGGLIFAMPVILFQIGRFILPGLYPKERKAMIPFFLASIILLLIGMTAAYLFMPRALEVLASFGSERFEEFFAPTEYLGFFVKMVLAFGIACELPLVLVFLQMVGVLKTSTLRKNRRIAFVAIVILAAVITPTGDPLTLAVVGVPMYILYEISMIIGGRLTKRRALS